MKEKERILVTGAGGFIGWHLARYLKKKGYWVRGVDIKDPEFQPSHADEFLLLDLRMMANCEKACKGVDWVFNLAANMGGIGYITRVHAPVMWDNALININMIEAARKAGVKRYFFSSSACVYPVYRQKDTDVSGLKEQEAIPAEPDTPYGWEKLFTEILLLAYAQDFGMKIRIARFHNIYGPVGTWKGGKEKAPAALCRKVAMADDLGEIVIWGDGKQTRSFCYIDDCVEGFYRLLLSNYNKPLNIGSDRMVTIDELADIIIEISQKKITRKYDPSKPQGVRGRNSDNTLMRKALNWEPKVELEEGLKITYEWIKDQTEKENTK